VRARDNRLAHVKRAIDASPVRRHLLREAYEWFTSFGELPEDDDHVAYEVVQQALRGGAEQAPEGEAPLAERVRKARLAYNQRERPAEAWPPSVRALLFDEALYAAPPLRAIARAQIGVEVAYGGDVESPGFGARHGIPVYGSIAMHMGGWPKNLVLPPYEFQATRLLVRFDNIRGRIDHDDPRWFEAQAEAVIRFKQTGKLPAADLHIEAVLANVELDQLVAHKHGQDVSDAMALLNAVVWRQGEEQEDALRRLCAMAAAGGIR
jgi:hypothetical protein